LAPPHNQSPEVPPNYIKIFNVERRYRMIKLVNFYIKNKTLNINKENTQKQKKDQEIFNKGNISELDWDDLII
jgi:hypothetical protein